MNAAERLALVAAPILAVLMKRTDTPTSQDVAESIALAETLIIEADRHIEAERKND